MTGVDPGSWAHDTITRRWPDIGRKILAENRSPQAVTDGLEALIREIPGTPIRPIADPGAPDAEAWREYVERFAAPDWLTPPWFFGEHYFYRRVMAVVGHFQPGGGAGGAIPFRRRNEGVSMRVARRRGISRPGSKIRRGKTATKRPCLE